MEGKFMKFRTDFVTNSSSSSFVIAYKPTVFDEETLEKYPVLKDYGKDIETLLCTTDYLDTKEAEELTTEDEIRDRFSYLLDTNFYYDDQIEANKKMIDIILEYFKKAYKIYTKDISSHNDTLIDMIYSIEKKNDNFKIIMEED